MYFYLNKQKNLLNTLTVIPGLWWLFVWCGSPVWPRYHFVSIASSLQPLLKAIRFSLNSSVKHLDFQNFPFLTYCLLQYTLLYFVRYFAHLCAKLNIHVTMNVYYFMMFFYPDIVKNKFLKTHCFRVCMYKVFMK